MRKKIFTFLLALTASVGMSWAASNGKLPGAFSVSSTKQVYFSQGNLQFTRTSTSVAWSTGKFSFMDHQYDYIETTADSYCTDDYANKTAIGLFGWATSNINTPANTYYQPWNTNTTSASYGSGITGDNINWSDNDNEFAKYDWGANTGDLGTGWRTLTTAEWQYLFNTRTVNGGTGSDKSYTVGQSVNGTPGVVLYPDNYTGATYTTGSTWSTFEDAGCVFLPAAGFRYGSSVSDVGSTGYYWSSTSDNNKYAYRVYFNESNVHPTGSRTRSSGFSVRLVSETAPTPAPTLVDGYYLVGSAKGNWSAVAANLFAETSTSGEYTLATSLTTGEEIKVVYVENSAITTWYPAEGANYTVDANHAGEKTVYFRPEAQTNAYWTPFGGHIYIAPNTANTLADGYYLIGQTGWTIDALNADLLFAANPSQEGEYQLDVTLTEGQTIKVVYVENDQLITWYPDGNGNYAVDAAHAGTTTIYFRPAGNATDWSAFGGYIYVMEPTASAITIRSGMTAGNYYTVCYNKAMTNMAGATFYSIGGKDATSIYLVEETATEITAGKPYIIQASATELTAVVGDATEAAGTNGAIHGTFADMDQAALDAASTSDVYLLHNNQICKASGQTGNSLAANRAYIVLAEVSDGAPSNVPANCVRRLPLQENTATGVDQITNDQTQMTNKVLRNGQLFIIKNGVEYNAQGMLVR